MAAGKRVLLIVGPGRSGSTLIERIIGNQPGYFSVGEVRYFWEYFQNEHRLCGCGQQIPACPFWEQVIREVVEVEGLDVDHLRTLSNRINRTAFLPLMFHFQRLYGTQIRDLTAAFGILYERISRDLSSAVIVDSSKIGPYAKMLGNIPDLDLRVLHLVRDPRAVAYSWKYRRKTDPSRSDLDGLMRERALSRSAAAWAMTNHYILKMRNDFNAYALLRYEDFVASPTAALNRSLAGLGLPVLSLDLDQPFQLGPTHSMGGNPLRFQEEFSVSDKAAWREELTDLQKYWVGLVTYPTLKKLSYKIRPREDS